MKKSTKKNLCGRLPECVWMIVFKYLEHQDLVKIIAVGQKFNIYPWVLAASSTTLWNKVTWRAQRRNKKAKSIPIDKMAKYIGPYTTSLKVIGENFTTSTWYFKLRARGVNLKRLQYSDCTFDFTHRPLFNLPRSINHLCLERVSFFNLTLGAYTREPNTFEFNSEVLPNLRSVHFKGCNKWLPLNKIKAARKKITVTLEND